MSSYYEKQIDSLKSWQERHEYERHEHERQGQKPGQPGAPADATPAKAKWFRQASGESNSGSGMPLEEPGALEKQSTPYRLYEAALRMICSNASSSLQNPNSQTFGQHQPPRSRSFCNLKEKGAGGPEESVGSEPPKHRGVSSQTRGLERPSEELKSDLERQRTERILEYIFLALDGNNLSYITRENFNIQNLNSDVQSILEQYKAQIFTGSDKYSLKQFIELMQAMGLGKHLF